MKELIKQLFRKKINEGKHSDKFEYGCVMVFLDVDKEDWDNLESMIDKDDLYLGKDDDDRGYGFEKEPHITLLYGLHEDIPLKDIEKVLKSMKRPNITMQKVTSFNNPDFGVLKFDVDGDDLHRENAKLTKFPHTTDYPDYHPHCTIAYIKPNKIDKYVKKFKDIEPIEVVVDKIVYSMADGAKKEYNFVD
jgi:2'-5' RNA ligase